MKFALILTAFSTFALMTSTAFAGDQLQQCNKRCRTEFKGKKEALKLCLAECQEKWNNPKAAPGNNDQNKETAPAK